VTRLGSDPFVHEAVFYRTPEEFLAATVPFVRDGLAAGEPVLVATPPGNGTRIFTALGADADDVRFVDMTRAGRNPGRIIPFVLNAFVTEHAGRPVRLVGEPIWPSRTDLEYPACLQHEALINLAFAGRPATVICPYDVAGLDERRVRDVAYTHPILRDGDRRETSGDYVPPAQIPARFNEPIDAAPPTATRVAFDAGCLVDLRAAVLGSAARAGLDTAAAGEFVVAVNEVATNSVRHGGGRGTAWIWHAGDGVFAQVADAGHLSRPLAGRLPPPDATAGGLGLLLANSLCDLVRMHTGPEGTTVRLCRYR
jgi:anti-sigma regulatory factor (Ser/Thr protein kinase)